MSLPLAPPAALALLLLCVGLGFRIEDQVARAPSSPDIAAPEPAPVAPVDLQIEPATPAPEVDFAAIEGRPLFMPDRRPWSDASATAGPPAIDLTLAGTVISEGERIAIVYAEHPGEPQRLRVGDGIAGWTLQSIEPNRVVLLLDDQRRELLLGTTR